MSRAATLVIAAVLVMMGTLGIAVTVAYVQPEIASKTAISGEVDAMFIEAMIPHHDDAIEMAELALTRAEHPKIRELAADIKRTQTAENSQMRAWYREWFGTTVPDAGVSSRMMGGMMGSGTADMADLEVSEPFDKAFIEAMVPHHQMAVMMSQMAGGASGRPEMRELTSTIIETQSIEIAKMQAWYNEWYGRWSSGSAPDGQRGLSTMMGRGYGYGMMGGYSWFGALLLFFFAALVVAGIVLLVVWAIRASAHRPASDGGTASAGAVGHEEAVAIAKRRLASGEIDKDQYAEIMRALGG